MNKAHDTTQEVSPLQGLLVGASALVGSACLAGTTHFAMTAKHMRDEGIDSRARIRAIPTAARALAVSTCACAGLGVAAWLGFLALSSRPLPDSARVSSFKDALALAQQQREAVRNEFHSRLYGEAAVVGASK
eukprot:jgi/Botrbrau1/3220/Bobra.37_2s0049.1